MKDLQLLVFFFHCLSMLGIPLKYFDNSFMEFFPCFILVISINTNDPLRWKQGILPQVVPIITMKAPGRVSGKSHWRQVANMSSIHLPLHFQIIGLRRWTKHQVLEFLPPSYIYLL